MAAGSVGGASDVYAPMPSAARGLAFWVIVRIAVAIAPTAWPSRLGMVAGSSAAWHQVEVSVRVTASVTGT